MTKWVLQWKRPIGRLKKMSTRLRSGVLEQDRNHEGLEASGERPQPAENICLGGPIPPLGYSAIMMKIDGYIRINSMVEIY